MIKAGEAGPKLPALTVHVVMLSVVQLRGLLTGTWPLRGSHGRPLRIENGLGRVRACLIDGRVQWLPAFHVL